MYQVQQIQLKQIDSYPDKIGGIYSWFYKPRTLHLENLNKLRALYGVFDFHLLAKSKLYRFKDDIAGQLYRIHHQDEIEYTDTDLEFIKTFIVNHGMPLYIGRTKNFSTRLKQHLECFYEELNLAKLKKLKSIEEESLPEDEFNDTSLESSVFGRRFARINDGQWMKMSDIQINLYKFNDKDIESVKRCEYYLNRLFRPILGNI